MERVVRQFVKSSNLNGWLGSRIFMIRVIVQDLQQWVVAYRCLDLLH